MTADFGMGIKCRWTDYMDKGGMIVAKQNTPASLQGIHR